MRILMISAFGMALIADSAFAQDQASQNQASATASDVEGALSTQGVDYAVDDSVAEEDDRTRARRYLRQAREMALQTQLDSKGDSAEAPAPIGGLQIDDEVMVNNSRRAVPEAN
jgi:hypothetical protein